MNRWIMLVKMRKYPPYEHQVWSESAEEAEQIVREHCERVYLASLADVKITNVRRGLSVGKRPATDTSEGRVGNRPVPSRLREGHDHPVQVAPPPVSENATDDNAGLTGWGYDDYQQFDALTLTGWMNAQIKESVLFAGVTGSHAWGLGRPESDVDIRGVYVKPTRAVLSLHPGRDTVERLRRDANGLSESDVQFYEIGKACHMCLAHNGNLIELALSPSVFYATTEGTTFREIAKKFLTKKLANYYRGYATSQRRRAAQNRGGKALVYTYREIFAGIWLMREGYIEYNFRSLWQHVEESGVYHSTLLPRIFNRPKVELVGQEEMQHFEREWDELQVVFDASVRGSPLPESYDGYNELNDLLLHVRGVP